MDKKRTPRFLSMLCILSFIWGALSIKSAIENLFFENNDLDESSFSFNVNSDSELPSYVQRTIDSIIDFWIVQQDHSILIQSSTLILTLISILGVYLMYSLKKKGFLLYTLSNLLLVIIPFIYYFNNTIGQLYIAFQFFFTAMFIFLYASQLKHMRSNKEVRKL